jgi:hypothetical protein
MHVQYVALCDQVIIGADGRPSLIGVVNDVTTPQLPVTLPRLAFAARLLFPADEANRGYRVEVQITDPNGVEVGRPGGEISLPAPPTGVDSVAVDIPLHFDLFELPLAGRYTFLLHVDGQPSAGAQLAVRQAAQA